MKRIGMMAAALSLLALLAGCANTAAGPDMAPGYDNTYGSYGTASGYGSTGNSAGSGAGTSGSYRGNVSTTNDGRVNGVNRTDRTGRTSTRPMNRTAGGSTGSANTDAMGAGMAG